MEVELIKANDPFDGSARRKIERLRVAAYCRVSWLIKSYVCNRDSFWFRRFLHFNNFRTRRNTRCAKCHNNT